MRMGTCRVDLWRGSQEIPPGHNAFPCKTRGGGVRKVLIDSSTGPSGKSVSFSQERRIPTGKSVTFAIFQGVMKVAFLSHSCSVSVSSLSKLV